MIASFLCRLCSCNKCLFMSRLHNLQKICLVCRKPYCCSASLNILTNCDNKKITKRSMNALKLQAMFRENNKAISKTESDVMQSNRRSSNPGTSTGRRSRSDRNLPDVRYSQESIITNYRPNVGLQGITNYQNPSPFPFHSDMTWSNSYQGFLPLNFTAPLFYHRSFSDSHVQQQQIMTIRTDNQNRTIKSSNGSQSNIYNNSMPRSHARESTNLTKAALKQIQLIKSFRTWYQTPLGKKLKHREQPHSCTFTVLSYNVLAQELLTEHPYLYREHNPKALQWETRWKNLYEEIKNLNADIMCFQEVQKSHLENYYSKLKNLGYNGVFKERTGIRTDGCAIYYKKSMFNLVEYTTVEFNQLNVSVLDRDNVAIIAKFSPKTNSGNEFIVATTHLLYNPRREDVRLAQTQVLLTEVDRFSFKKDNKTGLGSHLPIIITGDFNLPPSSPVYELVVNGMLQYEHLSSRTLGKVNKTSSFGKLLLPESLGITDECKHIDLVKQRKNDLTLTKEEELKYIRLQHSERSNTHNRMVQEMGSKSIFSTGTLSHDLSLKSAYEHQRGDDTEATTFQDAWVTVDYIFYSGVRNEQNVVKDGKLKLLSRYTIPTNQQLKGMKIPNFAVGSDHLSLAVKFRLDSK